MRRRIPRVCYRSYLQPDHRRKLPWTKECHTIQMQESHRIRIRQVWIRNFTWYVITKTVTLLKNLVNLDISWDFLKLLSCFLPELNRFPAGCNGSPPHRESWCFTSFLSNIFGPKKLHSKVEDFNLGWNYYMAVILLSCATNCQHVSATWKCHFLKGAIGICSSYSIKENIRYELWNFGFNLSAVDFTFLATFHQSNDHDSHISMVNNDVKKDTFQRGREFMDIIKQGMEEGI